MSNMKRFYLLAICLVFIFMATAQAARLSSVPQWGRWERSFQANPKTDPDPSIGLIVRLIAPSGKRHKVSAFWDGGKIWRVRFMPDEPGKWRYRTIAYPDYAGLNAQRGSFVCRKINESNKFVLHGAVGLTKDGTNLEHADGTNFLIDEGTEYIQFITSKQFFSSTISEKEPAFTGEKKIQINPAFFRLLDDRINTINSRGRLAVLDLFGDSEQGKNSTWNLPEAQIILLEKYLVARFGAHHVAWLPAGTDEDKTVEAEKWHRIFRAVFGDKHNQQIVLFPYQNWRLKLNLHK